MAMINGLQAIIGGRCAVVRGWGQLRGFGQNQGLCEDSILYEFWYQVTECYTSDANTSYHKLEALNIPC